MVAPRAGAALAAAACLLLLAAAWTPLASAQPKDVFEMQREVERLRKELQSRPDDFRAAYNLAAALHALDFRHPDGGRRVPEAERLYRRAAKLAQQPQVKQVINGNLGALLLSAERLDEALEVMESNLRFSEQHGLQRTDSYAGTMFNRVKALQQLGRDDEAAESLSKLVVVAKGVSASSYTKAWAAMRSYSVAQLAEMEACAKYLRLLKKNVNEARLSAARLAWWRGQEGEWGFVDGLPEQDEAWLHYALHRALSQRGAWDRAWQALVKANALQDPTTSYDRQREEGMTRAVQGLFVLPQPGSTDPRDAFWRRLLAGEAGHRDKTPIFVLGMPRSGSTLIEQILASHSGVWGAGEDTRLSPLIPSIVQVLTSKGDVDASQFAAIGRRYVDEMRAKAPPGQQNATWIVDKMLRNAWNVGFIQLTLPDSCIIHAVRHPADTGLSCFAQAFEGRGTPWASSLANIAHQLGLLESMMDHWDRVLPGKVLHVRYCDLVRDLEGTARRMLQHCGMPWEDGVLRFHETKRQVATSSLSQVRQQLYNTSIGRWKHYPPAGLAPLLLPLRQQIEAYEAAAGLDSSAALLEEAAAAAEEVAAGGEESAAEEGDEGGASGPLADDAEAYERRRDEL